MGRPLSKKYMGNRNVGSASTSADNGIGGEGVASAAVTVAGSYTTLRPAFTFTAPTLPGGVTATATITSEVLSATISGGTGYGNAQTFDLTVVTAGGTAILNVTSGVGGDITTVNSITSRGSFTTLGAVTSVSGGAGTGAAPVLTYRAKAVVITEPGSGYVTAPTVAGYTNRGGVTVNTIALTVDTGAVGSATNQENAIIAYAWIGGALVLVDLVKQISTKRYKVRYNGTNYTARIRYDAVADGSAGYTAAEGVELNIVALDSAGGSYLVRKLYNRTCTLNPVSISRLSATAGTAITAGKQTKWSFSAATTGVVQIENA